MADSTGEGLPLDDGGGGSHNTGFVRAIIFVIRGFHRSINREEAHGAGISGTTLERGHADDAPVGQRRWEDFRPDAPSSLSIRAQPTARANGRGGRWGLDAGVHCLPHRAGGDGGGKTGREPARFAGAGVGTGRGRWRGLERGRFVGGTRWGGFPSGALHHPAAGTGLRRDL